MRQYDYVANNPTTAFEVFIPDIIPSIYASLPIVSSQSSPNPNRRHRLALPTLQRSILIKSDQDVKGSRY